MTAAPVFELPDRSPAFVMPRPSRSAWRVAERTRRHGHPARLADYAEIVAAFDAVCGTTVLDTYTASRSDLAEAVIESDPVGTAVTQLLDGHATGWDGTAGELAAALAPPGPLPEHWPRTSAAMSGRLTRIEPALATLGITIERRRSNGTKLLRITHTQPRESSPDR